VSEEIFRKASIEQLYIIASYDDDLTYKEKAYKEILKRGNDCDKQLI